LNFGHYRTRGKDASLHVEIKPIHRQMAEFWTLDANAASFSSPHIDAGA